MASYNVMVSFDSADRTVAELVLRIIEALLEKNVKACVATKELSEKNDLTSLDAAVVFVSDDYMTNDTCRAEFFHILTHKSTNKIIPVVLSPSILNSQDSLDGPVGETLKRLLWIDFTAYDSASELKINELKTRIAFSSLQEEHVTIPINIKVGEKDIEYRQLVPYLKSGSEDHPEEQVRPTEFDTKGFLSNGYEALYGFVCKPLPEALGMIQLLIQRSRPTRLAPYYNYSLMLQNGEHHLLEILRAQHQLRLCGGRSEYLILYGHDTQYDGSEVAKLTSKVFRRDFLLNNDVFNVHIDTPMDLCAVRYHIKKEKGPRSRTVLIPAPDKQLTGLTAHLDSAEHSDDVLPLRPIDPKWSPSKGMWTQNFHGRVTYASAENCQLATSNEDSDMAFQLGRVGEDSFHMDVQHPVSLVQAFAISIAEFAFKIGIP